MWFKRDIASVLRDDSSVIQILRGPRQCGKTSLFLDMDPSFKELSLDDLDLRHLANEDPTLFLKQFNSEKIFIDEAQYAPGLFPLLKRKADLFKRENSKLKTIIRLTGSNQILMDRQVKESLAGRASFFDMNTLSLHEVAQQTSHISTQSYLYRGGWPELYGLTPKKWTV